MVAPFLKNEPVAIISLLLQFVELVWIVVGTGLVTASFGDSFWSRVTKSAQMITSCTD